MQKKHLMITHLLSVRTKSNNRLALRGEFESKAAALNAAHAILRANPDRFVCEVSHIKDR